MSDPEFDVVGIGNAIVDVLAHADDPFLTDRGLVKGSMSLIDAEQAERLYEEMGETVNCSGGSAANTMASAGDDVEARQDCRTSRLSQDAAWPRVRDRSVCSSWPSAKWN